MERVKKLIKANKSLIVLGGAGTGKSTIVKRISEEIEGKVIYKLAPTGTAANLIEGMTIHSYLGIKPSDEELSIEEVYKQNEKKLRVKYDRVKWTDIIIIDEVSMLHIKLFERMNKLLQLIKGSDKLFGGIQIILFGDFYQLPPIDIQNEDKIYIFETPIFYKLIEGVVILTKIHRQEYKEDIKILNLVREGSVTEEVIRRISGRVQELKPEETVIMIYSRNHIVDSYNKKKLESICSKKYKIKSEDSYKIDIIDIDMINEKEMKKKVEERRKVIEVSLNNSMISSEIEIKEGAQVILLRNIDISRGLVNGSVGKIKKIRYTDTEEGEVDIQLNSMMKIVVEVEFNNGITESIETIKNEVIVNKVGRGYRYQLPLKLAYAISIHKSQGMTIDRVHSSLSENEIFSYGQAYVLLSRIKSLDNLTLDKFEANSIRVDPRVKSFYKTILKQ